jgi:hypothetical protein
MIRMSRALGLTLMAALALVAFAASAAQAVQTPEFHVSTAPANIMGEQIGIQSFSTVNGNVTCNIAEFNGSTNVTTTASQTLTPHYENCTAFGFPATVNTNGCTYTFTLVKNSSPATANVNINCAAGKAITVVGAGCTTTVGSQNAKPHIILNNTTENGPGPTDIDAHVTLEKDVTYTASGCFANGTFNTGSVNGEATIRATDLNGVYIPLSVF